MKLFVAGISYKTAPVQVRERLAVTPSKLLCQRCRLKLCGGLDEVVVLSTCNRVEIYGVAARLPGRMDALFGVLTRGAELDVRPHVSVQEDAAAVRQLFRVASGLDSMVLGETEISAQVKHAYEAARRARERDLALCGRMIEQKLAGLMARLNLKQPGDHGIGVEPRAGRVSDGALFAAAEAVCAPRQAGGASVEGVGGETAVRRSAR